MIRRCDGNDPYLLKPLDDKDDDNTKYVPCDCGLVFDDAYRLTIYPHERF